MSALIDNKRLLRLYHIWPQRGRYDSIVEESDAFFDWLMQEHQHVPVIRKIKTTDDIKCFLETNDHLAGASLAGRVEPRFTTNIATLVSAIGDERRSGIASHCYTVDVGVHGVRLLSDSYLLDLSKVMLNLEPSTLPVSIYRLEGDTRWTGSSEDGFLIGVQIVETEDFERWRNDFEARFGAPLK